MRTVKRLALVLLFSTSALLACELDRALLHAYLTNERSMARAIGYPFLISFNNSSDAELVKKAIKANWIDKRTIDCEDLKSCIALTESLAAIEITNIDLGAYQINYRYWTYPTHEYFTQEAEKRVCEIVKEHSNKYGWSWKTLARYHSSTPKHNKRYMYKLAENYKKVVNE